MQKQILKIVAMATILISFISCNKKSTEAMQNQQQPTTLEEVQNYAIGEWESISVELRPTEDRTGSGEIQPTYLKRHFHYLSKDKFIGTITLFGDNYGQLPLMEFEFKGDVKWGEAHPIANGAWKIDYVRKEGFGVTPLHEQAAQMLNAALPAGMTPFEVNQKKDILGKAFPMFNIVEGQIVSDYDLIYFKNAICHIKFILMIASCRNFYDHINYFLFFVYPSWYVMKRRYWPSIILKVYSVIE